MSQKSSSVDKKNIVIVVLACALAVAVIILLVMIFGGNFGGSNNQTETTAPTQTTQETSTAAITQTIEQTTQPLTQATEPTTENVQETTQALTQQSITGTWKPVAAVDSQTGESVIMSQVFGSGFKEYGGSLKLFEDNTFSLWMGVGRDDGSHSGTYTMAQDGVNASFDNGTSQKFEFQFENDELAQIKCLVQGYYVYFEKQ